MYKNLLLIMAFAAFMWACGNQQTAQQEEVVEEEIVVEQPIMLTLAEFQEKAPSLVGREVQLEGDVIHVCKHGGKKMFITADDPDLRIKITSGEEMPAFEPELEGSHITVLGVVEEIESEVTGEGQLAEEGEHEEDEDHENYYHKPQYSLACIKYTVVETTPVEE
jgi:hypothetical protein